MNRGHFFGFVILVYAALSACSSLPGGAADANRPTIRIVSGINPTTGCSLRYGNDS